MAAENTLVFDFAGERHTEGQPFFHQIVAGERHAEGQPCFYQIRANAMPKDNRSFTKFGRTPCRRTTVLSPNCSGRTPCRRTTVLSPNCRDFAPDSNIVEGPFLQQIVIIKFHYLK
ncbi:uncharacterized protein [Atheta coriaria]|uniref:uncharacterized protein isoform X5 n=1 Tax=Dalotia coriaria TaxID=877792 RepID=UPI0031F4132C